MTEGWTIASDEMLVNAIEEYLLQVGLVLLFALAGTTAGTTILARMTHKYLAGALAAYCSRSNCCVFILFHHWCRKLMITIIMLYVATKVMEFVIEGLNPKKAITIISDNPNEIAGKVTTLMGRGVTVYSGHGYYTKTPKEILCCYKQEVVKLKADCLQTTDPAAFIAIHDVRDVFGEGFVDISKA